MDRSFLLAAGTWNLQGHLIKPNRDPIIVSGQISISWKQDNWFKILTRIATSDPHLSAEIIAKYRGNLNYAEKNYTYILHHSILGNMEGEGSLGLSSMMQYYWSVGSVQKRRGFDTFYYLNENAYYFTSSILEEYKLDSTIEATLKRQAN